VESWKNIKETKHKRDSKVFGVLERVHNWTWHVGVRRGFRKCKRSGSKLWRKNEYRSPKIREIRESRRTRVQKGGVARKLHRKNVIWIE